MTVEISKALGLQSASLEWARQPANPTGRLYEAFRTNDCGCGRSPKQSGHAPGSGDSDMISHGCTSSRGSRFMICDSVSTAHR